MKNSHGWTAGMVISVILRLSSVLSFALALILSGCAIGTRGANKNLFQAVASGSAPQEVEGLLANGANANVEDAYGNTPLHVAATHGYKDIAELLIAHGADVNAHPRDTETPLFSPPIMDTWMWLSC